MGADSRQEVSDSRQRRSDSHQDGTNSRHPRPLLATFQELEMPKTKLYNISIELGDSLSKLLK